jgi:hypothetical protein
MLNTSTIYFFILMQIIAKIVAYLRVYLTGLIFFSLSRMLKPLESQGQPLIDMFLEEI